MRAWKFFKGLIAASAVLVGAAPASSAESDGQLPPEILQATSNWSTCRASKIAELIEGEQDAGVIVDQAFQACAELENELTRVWEGHFGAGSGTQVAAFKLRLRASQIETIQAAQRGSASPNPLTAWGQCAGQNLPSEVLPGVDASSLADEVLAACSSEFDRVRQHLTEQAGKDKAEYQLTIIRDGLKKRLVAEIESMQAN